MNFNPQHLFFVVLISAVSRATCYDGIIIKAGVAAQPSIQMNETPKLNQPRFVPDIPDHCRSHSVCEDVPNYPQNYIDDMLQSDSTVRDALSSMMDVDRTKECMNERDPNEIDLCDAKTQVILPKAAKDGLGNWRFLVGKYGLCVELCKSPGQECSKKAIHVSSGYSATCKQKHIMKQAMMLNDIGEVMLQDMKIPSSCCCHTTQNRLF